MIRKDIIVKNGSIENLFSFLKIFPIFTVYFDVFLLPKKNELLHGIQL